MIFLYILGLILLIYMCTNIVLEDKFWIIIFILTFLLPGFNIVIPILIIGILDIDHREKAFLKDTKLNRWLFKSKFDK